MPWITEKDMFQNPRMIAWKRIGAWSIIGQLGCEPSSSTYTSHLAIGFSSQATTGAGRNCLLSLSLSHNPSI